MNPAYSPLNPLTWNDAREKFTRYTRTLMSAPRAEEIIAAVNTLENERDMAHIAALVTKT